MCDRRSTGQVLARSGDLLDHGNFEVSTHGWPEGDYTVLLESPSGSLMRRTSFSLLAKDTPVQVSVSCVDCNVASGGVSVTWKAAPGNRWDWLALWRTGAGEPTVWRCVLVLCVRSLCVSHCVRAGCIPLVCVLCSRGRDRWTNAQVDGVWALTGAELAQLANGEYTARLFLDQTQRALAESAPFVVSGARARTSRGGSVPSPCQRRR